MAELESQPLSDEERAELEELRAEKARREAQEEARREREELAALRAEHAKAEEAAASAASERKPAPKVVLGTKTLRKDVDYTVSYKNNKYAGTAVVYVTGKGAYTGKVGKKFTIHKAYQPLKASPRYKTRYLSAKKLRRAAQSVSNIRITKAAKGKITYSNASSGKTAKRFRVSSKGTVTVPRGVRAGLYTVRVKMTAAGTSNYYKGSVTVTFKIKGK